jgi:hypothetical protein
MLDYMQLKVCFSIPASATNAFYSQIAMFRIALDAVGGIYEQARLLVFLGGNSDSLPDRWKTRFGDRMQARWAADAPSGADRVTAALRARWEFDYSSYDVVVFCDADTMLIKPIDDVLMKCWKTPRAMGVIAHYPFPRNPGESSSSVWSDLARRYAGKAAELSYRYTLLYPEAAPEEASCPFYVNFGCVAMTPGIVQTIRDTLLATRENLMAHLKDPAYSGQVAFTLSALYHGIPTESLGMRFNFPNDPIADARYPGEVQDIRLLHYLRTDKFDRQRIFAESHEFRRFLDLDLEGSNRIFQDRVRSLTGGRYPF